MPAADHDRLPQDEVVPAGILALIGSGHGPSDISENHDYYVRKRMRDRFGDFLDFIGERLEETDAR